MTLTMSLGSRLCYREGYVATVMGTEPTVEENQVYVDYPFYKLYLCGGEDTQPSLFTCCWFFADEVLAALDDPDGSVFHQKVLSQTCRPSAFGIEIPNLDPSRILQPQGLQPANRNELIDLGYENTESLCYTEYTVLFNGQSLPDAIKRGYDWRDSTILNQLVRDGMNPYHITLGQYSFYAQKLSEQEQYDDLTEAKKTFLQEKQLSLSDNQYLWKYFHGSQMEHSDDELREALEQVYQTNLDFISGWKVHS